MHEQYLSTLSRLFRLPAKPASRHSTVEDLFRVRSDYFRSLDFPKNCKVIHVAGTKGKGSTCEYISSALRSIGTVGTFTSPHLHTARERFKVNRDLISKEDFSGIAKEVLDEIEGRAGFEWVVFFDYLVAIAIKYFNRHKLDYIVLETGIGGRYDSTNFLPACEVSVITRIGYDHQSILGDTLEEIAAQKAGIIKDGGTVFTPANQKSVVLDVIRAECAKRKAILHLVDVGRLDTEIIVNLLI